MPPAAPTPGSTPGSTPGDTAWFTHDRFGMFIHFGLYSLAARHEWVMSMEQIPFDVYKKRYFKHFDPDLYDPDIWAKAAADAGMKYFVITTKHHDGFCLWDSKHTDYKATNTPYGKDLLRPMVQAFNHHGLRTGFYHSLLDWQHPQYIIDHCNHPRRSEIPGETDVLADFLPSRGGAGINPDVDVTAGRDQAKYAEYLHAQVRELLTEYRGNVDVLWFDFSFYNTDRQDFTRGKGREAWNSEALRKLVRELAPDIVLNDRLDLDQFLSGGDTKTPEQAQPRSPVTVDGKPVVWETCQTFSGSWGYHRDEHHWRSTRQLITTLIDTVSKDGNLLLNVGPTGRGEIDTRALDRLQGIGRWMHHHSTSIYGCTQAPDAFPVPDDCRLTYHPEKKRLYIHLLNWPYKFLHLDGRAFSQQVEYAQLLHDASEVKMGIDAWHASQFSRGEDVLTLELPLVEPSVEVPVIELFLK